jgi:predicted protein tyrosine phosphatase
MSKNILFVCSANLQRSKTAEDYFSSLYPNLHFQSAGTNVKLCQKEGTNPLNEKIMSWADVVLVMEQKHAKYIKTTFSNHFHSKIIILSIEDKFNYYQPELLELLRLKTSGYF